jgi:hypothetical protein
VRFRLVSRCAGDHRWVLNVVDHALESVAKTTGWRSDALKDFVETLSTRPMPLVHFFERLARVEKPSGVKCVPWMSIQVGDTQVGVRIGDRDVTVISKRGPLYLEDTFPVAKSAIEGREYVLLDKAGKPLARVAMDASAMN